ncbi:MAG TPA: ABC transporter permease [Gemmatimonadaceae bacterium]|nr:ABC transporter permease [Gemmatimonadaceae bacterium]
MGKTFVVFKREYLERVRSKWFIIATVLGPVFLGLITVVPIVLSSRTKSSDRISDLVIIDATDQGLGDRIAKTLASYTPNAPPPRLRVVKREQVAAEEEHATQQVIDREALGYLVLDSATAAGTVRYAGRNATSLIDVQVIERTVRQAILAQRLEAEGLNSARVSMLTSLTVNAKTQKITDRGREAASGMASFFFGYVIALVLYMMIAIYGQNIMRGVLEEKTNRVAEVVVSSVKPDALLTGKILGAGCVALTQVVAWATMTFIMYQIRAPLLKAFGVPSMLAGAVKIPAVSLIVGVALLLFFLLGFILYASLFGAVGAMVSSQEDVQQAATPVMMLLIASIIFMQPVLLNPSSTLASVVSWLPFTAPIMMPLRMSLIAIPWYEIVGSLISVALGCWLAIWLSARIYRVGLLMYGKKPDMKELARWIRMA